MSIVPFQPEHAEGFRVLVGDTLREFGFEPDPALDDDLDDPAAAYAALWIALDSETVVCCVALRELAGGVVQLNRIYLGPAERGRGLIKSQPAVQRELA